MTAGTETAREAVVPPAPEYEMCAVPPNGGAQAMVTAWVPALRGTYSSRWKGGVGEPPAAGKKTRGAAGARPSTRNSRPTLVLAAVQRASDASSRTVPAVPSVTDVERVVASIGTNVG